MSLSDFFRDRKLKNLSGHFADLVKNDEIMAALSFYENFLLADETRVNAELRTIYHLYHWINFKDERDILAITNLAGRPNRSQTITRVMQSLNRFLREINLATALRARDPKLLTVPTAPTNTPGSQDMEKLGLAILETYRLRTGQSAKQTAAAVQRTLPGADYLSQEASRARKLLLLWSAWMLEQYGRIIQENELLVVSSSPQYQSLQIASAYAWGKGELQVGNLENAGKALAHIFKLQPADQVFQYALQWGIYCFFKPNKRILRWFKDLESSQTFSSNVKNFTLSRLATCLAYFQEHQYTAGRAALGELLQLDLPQEIYNQALFLLGLSWLAETVDWPFPDRAVDQGKADEQRLQNRALWAELRARLETVMQSSNMPDGSRWPSVLIMGMMAYLDSNVQLNTEQLKDFGAAINNVATNSQSQAGFKKIEGVLVTRARATEEAIGYIRRDDYENLAVLQSQVLDPLGDAVPPLVRAAVYLSLWQHNSDYDPTPDLNRIPRTAENSESIEQCIHQVQVSKTIKNLSSLCRNPQTLESSSLPSLTPFEGDPRLQSMGALALMVFYLIKKEWRAALEASPTKQKLPVLDDQQSILEYADLYAQWRSEDLSAAQISSENRYIKGQPNWQSGIRGRHILQALDKKDNQLVQQLLGLDLKEPNSERADQVIVQVLSLSAWNIVHRKPQNVIRLLEILEKGKAQQFTTIQSRYLSFLKVLSNAQADRLTACTEACNELLMQTQPDDEASGDLLAQTRLISLEVELALLARAGESVQQRWPSAQRSLWEQAVALQDSPELQPYGFLVEGLVSYLQTDVLVDEVTLAKLMQAQRSLELSKYAGFLQEVLGKLNWRRRVIADYWNSLANGDFKQTRAIYIREIAPAFGDRVPHSVQLGMILVDWNQGQGSTRELLTRLAKLEEEAPELNKQFIENVRKYILDGEQVRQFTELVKGNEFDAIIQFVESSEWGQKGIPIAVAIALLFAYYKKERMEDAKRFAENIKEEAHFPDWVINYGFFIKGYVHYREKNFDEAAEAFGKIRVSELLKHNTDRYWAVSQFSKGLQLLSVDNKEAAFKAFRLSMSQRGASQGNVNLAPLFAYFGLKNIESKNGTQAIQAFNLLEESLHGLENSAQILKSRIAADIGLFVSRSLIIQVNQRIPGSDEIRPMLQILEPSRSTMPLEDVLKIENALCRMAVAQELRKQQQMPPAQRLSKDKLKGFLENNVTRLKKMAKDASELRQDGENGNLSTNDLTLTLLEVLINLYFNPRNTKRAAELLTEAARLGGAQSSVVAKLLAEIQKEQQDTISKQQAAIDLLDAFLLQGSIPDSYKLRLKQSSELTDLYRLNRNYLPKELSTVTMQSSVDVMLQRVALMVCACDERELMDGNLVNEIGQLREQFKTQELSKTNQLNLIKQLSNIAVKLRTDNHPYEKRLGQLCEQVVELKEREKAALEEESVLLQEFSNMIWEVTK